MARKPAAPSNDSFNFETALNELNTIVEKMEAGGLSLEESLGQFERGIALTRQCQQALTDAQQKVQILMQKSGKAGLEPFAADLDDETDV